MRLQQTVHLGGEKVTRDFAESYKDTPLGEALEVMTEDSDNYVALIASAFGNIHRQGTRRIGEIVKRFLGKPHEWLRKRPVHWYWQEFYEKIAEKFNSDEQHRSFRIRIKACRDHYFYSLEGAVLEEGATPAPATKWELLNEPFFRRSTPPGRDEADKEEDVRGVADTLLFLGPAIIDGKTGEEIEEILSWFDLLLDIDVVSYDKDEKKLIFNVTPELRKTRHISLPPHHHPVLVSSSTFRDALRDLADVWLNRSAGAVLLVAAPGSGKEVLQSFLENALRLGKDHTLNVSAAEMGEFKELRKRLEQFITREAAAPDPMQENPERYSPLPHEHDSANRRQMVFIDEIHHDAAQDLRAGLLRVMEKGEFDSSNGTTLSCKNLLYVFAASKPVETLRSLKPADLWTRVEHTVVLRHPLWAHETGANRNQVIKDYFHLFWTGKAKAEYLVPARRPPASPPDMTHQEYVVDELAKSFVNLVGSPLIPLVSIRILRSIVKRLRSRTEYFRRTHPHINDPAVFTSTIKAEFDGWIVDIFRELVPSLAHDSMF